MDRTREAFERYLEDAGHGGMAKFAKMMGVTTQTLRRFKLGDNVSSENIELFSNALGSMGYMEESEEEALPQDAEHSHWSVIADDLEALAKLLRSNIDGDRKAEKFAYTVSFYNAEMEAGLARLKQRRE